MSREQVERVAQKWAEFFPPTPHEPDTVEEPEPAPEPIGKSSIIRGAGNQPGPLTDEQKKALTLPPADKAAHLYKLLRQQDTITP